MESNNTLDDVCINMQSLESIPTTNESNSNINASNSNKNESNGNINASNSNKNEPNNNTSSNIVAVKEAFRIHKTNSSDLIDTSNIKSSSESILNAELPINKSLEVPNSNSIPFNAISNDTNNANKNNKNDNKKRPRDKKPDQLDRLCHFILSGEICTFGKDCQYNHDPLDYLQRKPKDIGPTCYQFETFGWCSNGIMCMFGSKHIDYSNGTSIVRSIDNGGTKDKLMINFLDKSVQVQLRKKSYQLSKDRKWKNALKVSKPQHHKNNEDQIDLSAYDNYVKLVDFSNKVYVAPLTTVGNLPFRRILKEFGADITCSEMSMANNIQLGQASEWALLKRHSSEDCYGIQVACGHSDQMQRISKILENETLSNFVDLNCGCPIDIVCNRGCGSSLLLKQNKLLDIVKAMTTNLSRSVTVKIRTGWDEKNPTAHKLIPQLQKLSNGRLAAIMIHGRSRLQRYSRLANWEYVLEAARSQNAEYARIPIIGNGDILTFDDWKSHQDLIRDNTDDMDEIGLCSCAMIGRGALIKPWLPTEIKEQKTLDISASERLDIIRKFCNYGLEHWGSDIQGINATRRFLLEWLSFLHRYVPVGLLERPQQMSQRPPLYFGRCDTETLLTSPHAKDWIKISEMFLGPVADDYQFFPKHKSNSYSTRDEESNG